jgi:hypothetical protein
MAILGLPASLAWALVHPVLSAAEALSAAQWQSTGWLSVGIAAVYVVVLVAAAEWHLERADLEVA